MIDASEGWELGVGVVLVVIGLGMVAFGVMSVVDWWRKR